MTWMDCLSYKYKNRRTFESRMALVPPTHHTLAFVSCTRKPGCDALTTTPPPPPPPPSSSSSSSSWRHTSISINTCERANPKPPTLPPGFSLPYFSFSFFPSSFQYHSLVLVLLISTSPSWIPFFLFHLNLNIKHEQSIIFLFVGILGHPNHEQCVYSHSPIWIINACY